MNVDHATAAIILAAGKGTRMNSDLPKVVHPVAGRPMVCWVVDACRQAGIGRIVVVVGYQASKVTEALQDHDNIEFVTQAEQLGTGHAARMAQPVLDQDSVREVVVLAGDGPLIRAGTLRTLIETHRREGAAATLATSRIPNPSGYGRVLRAPDGGFEAIVEEKDADATQLAINEINPSYYCFGRAELFRGLERLGNDNRQGEYYLTDVPAMLKRDGKVVRVVDAVPPEDVLSINTPEHLREVDQVLRRRLGVDS